MRVTESRKKTAPVGDGKASGEGVMMISVMSCAYLGHKVED